jgi:4-hydroxy-3-methylbut-2-en-1-yl diphosphate reductase
VKFMAPQVEVVIVVGSRTSSNTNRLRELAQLLGCDTYQVDSATELQAEWIRGKKRIGVTSGASAPEVLVREVIAKLKSLGAASVRELDGITESIVFPLPRGLAMAPSTNQTQSQSNAS